MENDGTVYFSRQLAWEQPLVGIGMGGCVAAIVAATVAVEVATADWIATGVGSVVLLAICLVPFTVRVSEQSVEARFAGIFHAVVPMTEIASVEAREYAPLKQFGGWGWRFGRNGSRQYALLGKRAAVVTRIDGREVYLGARDVDALADAIHHIRFGPKPLR